MGYIPVFEWPETQGRHCALYLLHINSLEGCTHLEWQLKQHWTLKDLLCKNA